MKRSKVFSLLLVIGLLVQCLPVFAAESLVGIDTLITTESRSFFIDNSGKLYSSGSNINGISGLGNLVLFTNKAVEVPFISNVKDVAANSTATYYTLSNGDVYISGIGSNISSIVPIKVEGLSNVNKIVTNGNSIIALKTDGTVYIQGDNSKGQLGAGSTKTINTFTKLSGVSGVIDVQMGDKFTIFLFDNGLVKATGLDVNGRLGVGNPNNSTTIVYTPINVSSPVGISKISVGKSQVLYIGIDGNLYTTGSIGSYIGVDSNNSLGINIPTNVSIFNDKTIKDIKSAEGSFVLLSDNTLWTVGLNSYGQALTGDTATKTTYTKVASNISEMYVGEYQTFFNTHLNELKAVGKNTNGELSIGSKGSLVLSAKEVLTGLLLEGDELLLNNSVIKDGKIYFRHAALLNNKITMSGSGDINGDTAINNGTINLNWTTYIKGDLLLGDGVSKNLYRDTGVTGEVRELHPKLLMPILDEVIHIPTAPLLPNKGSVIVNSTNTPPVINESGAYETISIQTGYTLVIDTEGKDVHLSIKNLIIGQGFIDIVGGGVVYLYLDEPIHLGNGSSINNSGIPEQLHMYIRGSGVFKITGAAEFKGNLYGPYIDAEIGNGGKFIGDLFVGGSRVYISGVAPLKGNLYAPNGNVELNGSSGIQGNVITGGTAVKLTGLTTMTGGVYAPRADVVLNGSSRITGALIANSVDISGGSYINYEDLVIDVPGYVEPEAPIIPKPEPEVPTDEEPNLDDDIPEEIKDLEYELIINVVTDGRKRIGAPLLAYGEMLEHVDNSNNNLSLKRVNKLISIFGAKFSKDLKHGSYNFYEE